MCVYVEVYMCAHVCAQEHMHANLFVHVFCADMHECGWMFPRTRICTLHVHVCACACICLFDAGVFFGG